MRQFSALNLPGKFTNLHFRIQNSIRLLGHKTTITTTTTTALTTSSIANIASIYCLKNRGVPLAAETSLAVRGAPNPTAQRCDPARAPRAKAKAKAEVAVIVKVQAIALGPLLWNQKD
jgi:hypothetical protein